jgi:hypothetical protein
MPETKGKRCRRRRPPCARVRSRKLPVDAGVAGRRRGIVAELPTRKAREDRGEWTRLSCRSIARHRDLRRLDGHVPRTTSFTLLRRIRQMIDGLRPGRMSRCRATLRCRPCRPTRELRPMAFSMEKNVGFQAVEPWISGGPRWSGDEIWRFRVVQLLPAALFLRHSGQMSVYGTRGNTVFGEFRAGRRNSVQNA